ncbi:unnamed protein product, partial [marine sediment metagenome]
LLINQGVYMVLKIHGISTSFYRQVGKTKP